MNIFKIVVNLIVTLILAVSYIKIETVIHRSSKLSNTISTPVKHHPQSNVVQSTPVGVELPLQVVGYQENYNNKYRTFRFKIPANMMGDHERRSFVKPGY